MRFLNVDLDLIGRADFDALARVASEKLLVLHAEKRKLYVELLDSRADAEATILAFYEFYASLSERSRREWHECERRTFDVGVEVGQDAQEAATISLSREAISRLGEMDGDLAVTIYVVS